MLLTQCTGRYSMAILLLLFVTACATPTKNVSDRPAWVDSPPTGALSSAASASYEIFGEAKAREKAVYKAISMIALQKVGKVDVQGDVEHVSELRSNGGAGALRERALISVKTQVDGHEIPVNAQIKAYWKDTRGKRVWVLMSEE
jgi:hypothetical protein